jgi:hypothetical protein
MTRFSRIGALLLILWFGIGTNACAGILSRSARDDMTAPAARTIIRFDNSANEYVDVYLAAEQRQWRLGRVAPGAKVSLPLPADDLAAISGFVRLVVLGPPASLQAAGDPRGTISIAQPVSELLQQDWTFSASQASTPQLLGRIPQTRRP